MAGSLLLSKEWVVQITHMLHNDDNPQEDAHLIPPNEQSQADADPILPPNEQSQSDADPIILWSNDRSQADADPNLRVARHLLNSKPDGYIPQIFCFGPYYHSKLEKDIDSSCRGVSISTAEVYKGKYAAKLSQDLRTDGKSFNSIVEIMEKNLEKIQRFYDWPIDSNTEDEYSKNFALMMAVDSAFLFCFFISLFKESNDGMLNLYPFIKHDILKMENQIPLCILTQVFETVKSEAITVGKDFNQLLNTTMNELSPFGDGKMEYYKVAATEHNIDCNLAKERHLLGCMHGFVSQFLDIETGGHNQPALGQQLKEFLLLLLLYLPLWVIYSVCSCFQDFEIPLLNGLSAQQLSRVGIKFESFSKPLDKIRFDKQSDTIYLPNISVSEVDTEVLLRNMLALEFNTASTSSDVKHPVNTASTSSDAKHPVNTASTSSDVKHPVTNYVALMSILMQSPTDVRLLIDKGVIVNGINCQFSEEDILKMWNRVSRPFFTQSSNTIFCKDFEDALELKYYKTKIKRMILGIYDFVSNWKFLGSVGALLVIVMTFIQTYCAVVQLLASRGSSWKTISLWKQI